MTAYAPTWTARMKISYFAGQAIHTQTWRFPGPAGGSGQDDLIAVIQPYLDALAPIAWNDWQINAVTVADINSPIFLPIVNPFSLVTGSSDIADFEPEDKADAVTFVGRTTAGGPWKISQFGIDMDNIELAGSLNFRVLASENVNINSALGFLAAGGGTIIGNDGNSVAIYQYADLKANDRWVKKVRRGA